jgi:uncharacterized DUF497 family protein
VPELQFAWDPKKAVENEQKHGVSFEEAQSVFTDEHALLIDDPEHSADEERLILMGLSARLRILVVVHSYREPEEIIRIISARKASRKERSTYIQRWRT